MIGALHDKSAAVRKEALGALTLRKEKAAVPALLELMADPEHRFDGGNADSVVGG